MHKNRKLFQRIGAVVLTRFIRHGEMRKDSFRKEAGQTAGLRNTVNFFCRNASVTEKTEARHTAVYLDVHAQFPAERRGSR